MVKNETVLIFNYAHLETKFDRNTSFPFAYPLCMLLE